MEVLGAASRTRMRRYADTIAGLTTDYPEFWWLIAVADIKMRRMHLERIRRRVCSEHNELSQAGMRSPLDPSRPWDLVFREAARDVEYWQKEVDKKVIQYTTSQRSRPQLIDPGFGPLHFAGGAPGGRTHAIADTDAERPKGKRVRLSQADRRRVKQATAGAVASGASGPPPPPAHREERKGKGGGKGKDNDLKDPNGKYYRSRAGKQLCWNWNKEPRGCAEPCRSDRAHLCEICRGERGVPGHRTCEHVA